MRHHHLHRLHRLLLQGLDLVLSLQPLDQGYQVACWQVSRVVSSFARSDPATTIAYLPRLLPLFRHQRQTLGVSASVPLRTPSLRRANVEMMSRLQLLGK